MGFELKRDQEDPSESRVSLVNVIVKGWRNTLRNRKSFGKIRQKVNYVGGHSIRP